MGPSPPTALQTILLSFVPFTVWEGMDHGNTYFVMLLLKVTNHVLLCSEVAALTHMHEWFAC